MSLHIGDTAPNFSVDSTAGNIDLYQWSGDSWVFFFSHPADFTPVCTTEMGKTANLAEEFNARNVKPLGLSTDTVDEHVKWIVDVNDTQKADLQFPIVADQDRMISALYDMLHPKESTTDAVRSVFIIDPQNKRRSYSRSPLRSGLLSLEEILTTETDEGLTMWSELKTEPRKPTRKNITA